MEGRAHKPRSCHFHLEVLNTSPRNLAADVESNSAGLPIGHIECSSVEQDSVEGTTSSQTRKRQLEAASARDFLPAKRTRLAERISPVILAWQRHIYSDGNRTVEADTDVYDNTNKTEQDQAQLTRRNLALFNKMTTGEGTGDALESALLESTGQTTTTKMKSTSTTRSGFANAAYQNGILPPDHSKPPTNLNERHKLASSYRRTASPTVSEYERYVRTLPMAFNELARGNKVSRKLQKDYDDDESYHPAFNQSFTGFPKDVGLNNGLSPPQPDFIEGLGIAEFQPFPIQHVSGAVLYKDNPLSTALPHIAGEYKGPTGCMENARLQCSYDGAALVYARNKALALIGKPDPQGHAKITTFATDGKTIEFFAHYAARGDDGKLKYHQYPIGSCFLTTSHYGFKDGWRQLQNQQDYAREQSYALRDQLVNYWVAREGIASSTPRSFRIEDLNQTWLESWDKIQTGLEEGAREDLRGTGMRNISWPARSIVYFGVCVFVGATVAWSNVWELVGLAAGASQIDGQTQFSATKNAGHNGDCYPGSFPAQTPSFPTPEDPELSRWLNMMPPHIVEKFRLYFQNTEEGGRGKERSTWEPEPTTLSRVQQAMDILQDVMNISKSTHSGEELLSPPPDSMFKPRTGSETDDNLSLDTPGFKIATSYPPSDISATENDSDDWNDELMAELFCTHMGQEPVTGVASLEGYVDNE
ncbi:hypothetical protein VE04_03478 [Pseudogymnoascus sp. 24MN13]|nr:hypothetical protein VE04_03478 [Pseudogymnoascus sp. 24MN13]